MTSFKELLSQKDAKALQKLIRPKKISKKVLKKPAPLDDKQLFLSAVKDVTPLKSNHCHTYAPKKQPTPAQMARRAYLNNDSQTSKFALSDMGALLNPVDPEGILSYKSTALQNKVFNELRLGKLTSFAHVDLHNQSIDMARKNLLDLIAHAQKHGENVITVVHGKGDGVIKTCVNGWLKQIDDVLGFCSAPKHQGGTGATLVLLKRHRL